MNINPLIDLAKKTGGQVAMCVIVPISGMKSLGAVQHASTAPEPDFPGDKAYAASADYSVLWWFGTKYFIPEVKQRMILRLMIEAWENGADEVPEVNLCKHTGVLSIVSAFRSSPIFGSVIVPCADDQGRACVRLSMPTAA